MVKFCSVAATLRPGVKITYPTSCFRPSSEGENYLAEVLAPLHPLLRGAGVLQRVDAVNHLLQLSTSEELDHLQQLTLAPHVAPMETQLPTKDVPQVCDSLGPGRCPAGDEPSALCQAPQALFPRCLANMLDHDIYPTLPRQLPRLLGDVLRPVVYRLVGAEFLGFH